MRTSPTITMKRMLASGELRNLLSLAPAWVATMKNAAKTIIKKMVPVVMGVISFE
jgi:hypothetical protein